MIKTTLKAAVAATALAVSSQSFGLTFNLTPTGNAQADAGFQMAADFLEGIFSDAVTVNITSGFAALPAGVLGSAGSTQAFYNYNAWKGAMAGDQTSADDATMVAGLPAGQSYSKLINPAGDNNAVVLGGNTNVRLSNANAKALGLLGANQAGQDAEITFSSNFTWDFDPTDGIDAGAFDFVGVAVHELIHAMGFISGVDILDINIPCCGAAAYSGYASGLDFTRFSGRSEAAGADIDWTADTRDKYYSIDGGTTSLIANAWSTGVNFGDGRQASHWKDNMGIGIMDPTSQPPGNANIYTANDQQALDVIGWDVFQGPQVPAPASLLLIASGLLLLRRKNA